MTGAAGGPARKGMFPAVFRLCLGKQAGMNHAALLQAAAESLKQVAKGNREWSIVGGKVCCLRGKELLLVLFQEASHGHFHFNLADLARQVATLQLQLEQAFQVEWGDAGTIKREQEFALRLFALEAAEELHDSPVAAGK